MKTTTKKTIIGKGIAAGILLAVVVALSLLKLSTSVSEWFTTHFARWWITIFGTLFGWLPISAYELFLILAAVYLLYFVITVIVRLSKKQRLRALSMTLTLIIVVFSFLSIYSATAGFAYNREPLPFNYYEYSPDNLDFPREEAIDLVETVLFNLTILLNRMQRDAAGVTVAPYDVTELGRRIAVDFDRVLADSSYFSSFNVAVKPILNRWIMSQMRISGVFFAPTGVATVNMTTANYHLPLTVAHEMAHGKGVMYETDADLVASYVCLQSTNPYILYSAYVNAYAVLYDLLSFYDDETTALRDEMYAAFDPARLISNEKRLSNEKWQKYTLFKDFGEKFNDFYLKLQGESNGTGSYLDGTTHDTEPIVDGNTGEVIGEKVVYLSRALRLIMRMYLDGKITRFAV
jgi:hypothetical protein